MTDFAKLFHHPERGQVLVLLDSDDDGVPGLRFYSMAPAGSGLTLCHATVGFTDDDEGWEKATAALAKIDEAMAFKSCAPLWEMFDDMAA